MHDPTRYTNKSMMQYMIIPYEVICHVWRLLILLDKVQH